MDSKYIRPKIPHLQFQSFENKLTNPSTRSEFEDFSLPSSFRDQFSNIKNKDIEEKIVELNKMIENVMKNINITERLPYDTTEINNNHEQYSNQEDNFSVISQSP